MYTGGQGFGGPLQAPYNGHQAGTEPDSGERGAVARSRSRDTRRVDLRDPDAPPQLTLARELFRSGNQSRDSSIATITRDKVRVPAPDRPTLHIPSPPRSETHCISPGHQTAEQHSPHATLHDPPATLHDPPCDVQNPYFIAPPARTPSSASLYSQPQTPVDQISDVKERFTHYALESVSSLATTDDEDLSSAESGPAWTEANDKFLWATLDEYTSNPTNAPFSGRFPPGAVVEKVAKRTLKRAAKDHRPFPYSIPAIRKRLLVLCSHDCRSCPSTGDEMDLDSLQSEEFDFTNDRSHRRNDLGVEYGLLNQPNVGVVPVESGLCLPFTGPLNGPAPAASTAPESHEEVLNIVAKRKRDSLKLKRGIMYK